VKRVRLRRDRIRLVEELDVFRVAVVDGAGHVSILPAFGFSLLKRPKLAEHVVAADPFLGQRRVALDRPRVRFRRPAKLVHDGRVLRFEALLYHGQPLRVAVDAGHERLERTELQARDVFEVHAV
jgi:hypothetical protein